MATTPPILPIRHVTIAAGDDGTRATLRIMRSVARSALTDPLVRRVGVDIASRERPGDTNGIISGIADFCRARVRFVRDPVNVEQIHTPNFMLREIAQHGAAWIDCDDAAVLVAALAGSVGVAARFVALGFFDRAAPYSHVWAELQTAAGHWVVVDPTRAAQGIPGKLDSSIVARYMILAV